MPIGVGARHNAAPGCCPVGPVVSAAGAQGVEDELREYAHFHL